MFNGRMLAIATKHRKEEVLAGPLEKELGVRCLMAQGLDTDLLGTFTGEIERKHDPITAARIKCEMAMEITGADLAVASEGSFGPHPELPFLHANEEIVLLLDRKNQLEIKAREITTDTNFNSRKIDSPAGLMEFARQVQFPSHGLILRSLAGDAPNLRKGIQDWETLVNAFTQLSAGGIPVQAETDMRAFCNPSRMKTIQKAAEKLIQRVKSTCPQCHTPGFGISDYRQGLPCSLCGAATRSVLSYVSACQKCSFTEEEFFPNGKKEEDPMYCDYCNP